VSGERALPGLASLRYLKVAAKRRHASGEFATLHAAQLAVAREHGQPSWAALRRAVEAQRAADGRASPAARHLRWIVTRFAAAGEPGWEPPGRDELRAHFSDSFLAAVPPGRLIEIITGIGQDLRAGLVITGESPYTAQGHLGDHLVAVVTEHHAPFLVTGARARRHGTGVSDPRAQAPPVTAGTAQEQALAGQAMSRLGLASLDLAAAGGAPEPGSGSRTWGATAGWAILERGEPLRACHRFPAFQVTMAVTAVAVLCLAAAGRLRLDDRANALLPSGRLADDAVTVRELLAHTAGVSDPPALFTPAGPEAGPGAYACAGRRGSYALSHAGYGALGEVVAARAGQPYGVAVTLSVASVSGLAASVFAPPRPAAAVTGYDVGANRTFRPVDPVTCVYPAAAGLWTTAADLARFGHRWPSLLPKSLAAQALRPHAAHPNGTYAGLGWILNPAAGLTGLTGDGPGGSASLLVAADGRAAAAALTSRQIAIEPVNAALLELARMR